MTSRCCCGRLPYECVTRVTVALASLGIMPPRRRARGEKLNTKAHANTATLTETFPNNVCDLDLEDCAHYDNHATLQEKPQESDFKRLLRKAAFRLTVIVLFIFMTRRVNNDAKQFHTKVIPWQVQDFPGRGKGMVATRLIKVQQRSSTLFFLRNLSTHFS